MKLDKKTRLHIIKRLWRLHKEVDDKEFFNSIDNIVKEYLNEMASEVVSRKRISEIVRLRRDLRAQNRKVETMKKKLITFAGEL